jgi:uncharacterized protein YjiS (DUF1127 family)
MALIAVADTFSGLAARYSAWKAEKQTRAELMRLTDAELADIGLARYQIRNLNLKTNA